MKQLLLNKEIFNKKAHKALKFIEHKHLCRRCDTLYIAYNDFVSNRYGMVKYIGSG